jgi:tetratricopeptide (TPR) repeat protein
MTLQTHKSALVAAALAAMMLLPTSPRADDEVKAEKSRDRAIANLVAWRLKPTANNLDKDKEKYQTTQPFKTAEGLLIALQGLETDDDGAVGRGLKILDDQAKADPTDPIAEFYRGEILSWQKQSEPARKAWRSAKDRAKTLVKADPKDARAQYYLGAAQVRLKEAEAARTALRKAFSDGFDPAMVNFQIGLSYLVEEKWQAAHDTFDTVQAIDPRFAYLYYFRGLTWDKLGRKDNLLIDLNQFVKLAPNAPEAKSARAILAAVGG